MNKIELLAPAGDLQKAKIALMYGADAVYIGGKSFSLRARASNFTLENIEELTKFAHSLDKKVYVTMNIIPHDEDFEGLSEYLLFLQKIKVDAIITQSLHFIKICREIASDIECHISTQASITNSTSVNSFSRLGATRVVLAREVTLCELESIMKNVDLEIEYFIHGGMCSSYSGRCLLSNYMTNRDANRGGCAHSCRWNYNLIDDQTKQNPDNKYFNMGSKDLNGLKAIEKLISLNVSSLKIEGRMKSLYYLATVVRCYRNLIDNIYDKTYIDYDYYESELKKAENRIAGSGFLYEKSSIDSQLFDTRSEQPTKEFVGYVKEYNNETKIALIEQRNYFEVNDTLEFFGPNLKNTKYQITSIKDYNTKEQLEVARHPLQLLEIYVPIPLKEHDMVRLINK